MSNFHTLPDAVRSMAPKAPGADALRLLARGQFAAAAIVRSTRADGQLHRQPNHEELLIVLEGEADFRVGDEVRHIRPGDFMFVPRNATHGAVAITTEPLSLLSVITPEFDLAKDVVWETEAESPRYQLA
jgi:quercetin dioxygenase-like cupin family protein